MHYSIYAQVLCTLLTLTTASPFALPQDNLPTDLTTTDDGTGNSTLSTRTTGGYTEHSTTAQPGAASASVSGSVANPTSSIVGGSTLSTGSGVPPGSGMPSGVAMPSGLPVGKSYDGGEGKERGYKFWKELREKAEAGKAEAGKAKGEGEGPGTGTGAGEGLGGHNSTTPVTTAPAGTTTGTQTQEVRRDVSWQ